MSDPDEPPTYLPTDNAQRSGVLSRPKAGDTREGHLPLDPISRERQMRFVFICRLSAASICRSAVMFDASI